MCRNNEIESVTVPVNCEFCGAANAPWLNMDSGKEESAVAAVRVVHSEPVPRPPKPKPHPAPPPHLAPLPPLPPPAPHIYVPPVSFSMPPRSSVTSDLVDAIMTMNRAIRAQIKPVLIAAIVLAIVFALVLKWYSGMALLLLTAELAIVILAFVQEHGRSSPIWYVPDRFYATMGPIMVTTVLLGLFLLPSGGYISAPNTQKDKQTAQEAENGQAGSEVPAPQPGGGTATNENPPPAAEQPRANDNLAPKVDEGQSESVWGAITAWFKNLVGRATQSRSAEYLGKIRNLRDRPSEHGRILDKILPPNTIERTGETNGTWIKITCCGKTGWIYNEDGVVVPEMPEVFCRAKTNGLNLRNGPSVTAGIEGTLSLGERCQYLATSDDGKWGQVKRSTGDEGWVSQRYINIDQHW